MSSEKRDAAFDLLRKYGDIYSKQYNTKKGRQYRIKKIIEKIEKDWRKQ